MGKRTGYEILDGKYYIAPTHSQSFDEISTARSGVDELVRTVNNYAAQQYAISTSASGLGGKAFWMIWD
jgi:hypothetical protein